MTDPEVRRDALDLLHGMMAEAEAEDWERAVGAVVVLTDLATGRFSVYGPLADAPAALAYAEELERDVNRGASPEDAPPWNLGWQARVYPLIPPGES